MVTATKDPNSYEEVQELALQRSLTAEDLASLPDDGNRYEIIGGQLIVSPSPSTRHQKISFKLAGAIDAYLTRTGSGDGFSAPMDVHLSSNDVVQPDILVVLRERNAMVQETGIFGVPDLVIEILSPSSISNDFLRKSRLYERYGVQEYWIFDPIGETVSVQTLEGDRFVLTGEFGRNNTVPSEVLAGFELDLSTVFPAQSEEGAQTTSMETTSTNDQ